jgi:hypothetical protein
LDVKGQEMKESWGNLKVELGKLTAIVAKERITLKYLLNTI